MDISINCSIFRKENRNIMKGSNNILPETKRSLKLYQTFGFKQIIQLPTRVMHSLSAVIDHIVTILWKNRALQNN